MPTPGSTSTGQRRWLVRDVSLSVRAGEIVGIAGLQGSGNSELLRGIFGAYGEPGRRARSLLDGAAVPGALADGTRSRQGLAFLTSDRKGTGLVLTLDLARNVTLASLPASRPAAGLREAARAPHRRRSTPGRCASGRTGAGAGGRHPLRRQPAEGGAGQVARDPPRGAAARRAHPRRGRRRQARDLRADEPAGPPQGLAILLITSEMPELLGLARPDPGDAPGAGDGRARRAAEATQEKILKAAMADAHREETPGDRARAQLDAAGRGRAAGGSCWTCARPWVRALAPLVLVLLIGVRLQRRRGLLQVGHPPRHAPAGLGLRHPGLRHDPGHHHRRHRPGRWAACSAVAAVLFSLLSIHLGWSAWAAILAGAGGGRGLRPGLGRADRRASSMQPFIATLAMMVFARGLAKSVSGGAEDLARRCCCPTAPTSTWTCPASSPSIDQQGAGRQPRGGDADLPGRCVAACWVLLAKLRWGRYLYAIGGNEEAARLSGVPVRWVKLLAYGLSRPVRRRGRHLPGRPGAAGRPGGRERLRADRHRHRGHRRHQPATAAAAASGFTLLGALTIGYLEKILSINAVARGEPPDAHRRHHRRRRAVPEEAGSRADRSKPNEGELP